MFVSSGFRSGSGRPERDRRPGAPQRAPARPRATASSAAETDAAIAGQRGSDVGDARRRRALRRRRRRGPRRRPRARAPRRPPAKRPRARRSRACPPGRPAGARAPGRAAPAPRRRVRGQKHDLGVDVLEHVLELVVVPNPDDDLEPELMAALGLRRASPSSSCGCSTTASAPSRPRRARARRRAAAARCGRAGPPSPADDDALGAALLGARAALRRRPDLDEHRDPVALCDRLAQPSMGHGADASRSAARADPRRCRRLARRGGGQARRACSGPSRPVSRRSPRRSRSGTRRSGTPSTAGRTRSSGARRTRRGRAGSSPTSRGSTAGTRTSSPVRTRGAVLRHRRVHDRRLPRGVPRPARDRVRGARRAAVRPVRRLRPRRALAPRRDPRVRGAAPLDARALRRAGAGSGSPWLLVEGPLESGSRRPRRGRRACSPRSHVGVARGASRSRHEVGTLLSPIGQRSDRIGSGWWVGVPRRSVGRARPLSARSGARPSSAP